ncbi:MAG: hypothetical protein HPY74_05950 [Firmicutes bacterium]|nr:hypothetical protein [Bacillota bacterium]
MTQDIPTKEEYLVNENALLAALLKAAEGRQDESNFARVDISRKGNILFSFRVRPLGEDEYNACRDKYTRYVRNKGFGGLKLPEETDTVRYRSALIYTATIKEDREKIWDNKDAWKELRVLNGIDLIDKVLFAGEKDKIVEIIDKISGYDSSMEEVAKNS